MTSERMYNFFSGLFVLLSVLVMVFVVIQLLQPPPAQDAINVAALPTEVTIPTITPTFTLTPTITRLPPSWTPTFTPSDTPTETPTPTNTIPPTPTITDTPRATDTPSITFTPSVSPTLTPTHTPTGPTPTFTPSISPFPFTLRDPVRLTTNFANPSAGCLWQGIGGVVLDLSGTEFKGPFRIHVFDSSASFDKVVDVGTNSLYGTVSGWEVVVANQLNTQLYYVQLETSNGTQVSPRIEVEFPGTCDQAAAIVSFIQTRPF